MQSVLCLGLDVVEGLVVDMGKDIKIVEGVPSDSDLMKYEAVWKRRKNVMLEMPLVDKGVVPDYCEFLAKNSGMEVSQAILSELLHQGVIDEDLLLFVYGFADLGNKCQILMRSDVPEELVLNALYSGDHRIVEAAAFNPVFSIESCVKVLAQMKDGNVKEVLFNAISRRKGWAAGR